MWVSASCSERLRTLAVAAALLLGGTDAVAKLFLSQPQALELAFGAGAAVERQSHFLTPGQIARARELAGAGVRVEGALVTRYVGRKDGRLLGTAYFDSHRVRTLPETLMVVVGPEGKVTRVEVLTFGEPDEYLPRPAWYGQFRGRALDRELAVSRAIHGVTGATLSARATTEAVRRTLALHQVLP
ncbi:MAG TPA: FMN-binding protein [Candidatus Polarisedimenticolaceae bacterium]|nr:FMN-binding protein [Candidatus Polarisedimenticolaceae bacterium]